MGIETIIIYALIVLEMLFVNLLLVDLYAIKKYSKFVTYTCFIILTVFLISFSMIIMKRNANFGNGNGLFILLGSIYIIPIKFLYKPPLKKSLVILYTSWVYTALAFTIGVQFARLLPSSHFALAILIFQTIIYTITLYIFNKVFKRVYANILKNISEKICTKYLYTAFLMYLSIVAVNYAFISNIKVIALISFILFGTMCTFCFYFVFSMVLTKKDNEELGKLSYYDRVTDSRNRNALLVTYDEYIKNAKTFTIAFIDLDQFKKINDIYGHNDGDEYLYNFAKLTTKYLDKKAEMFHLHGDEFILLSYINSEGLNQILLGYKDKLKQSFPKHNFLGFSVGIVDISDMNLNLDEALAKADIKLYEEKSTKEQYRRA